MGKALRALIRWNDSTGQSNASPQGLHLGCEGKGWLQAELTGGESQQKVYSSGVQSLVDACLKGCSGSVITYGGQGSGKSYALGCLEPQQLQQGETLAGILTRCVAQLFQRLGNAAAIQISCAEVQQEEVADLLDSYSSNQGSRQPQATSQVQGPRSAVMKGLTAVTAYTAQEALAILQAAMSSRQVLEVGSRHSSSRAHAVFQLRWRNQSAPQPTNATIRGGLRPYSAPPRGPIRSAANPQPVCTLTLVDTACFNSAVPSKEGAALRKSLLALGRVLVALQRGEACLLRESKLTRMLEGSLDAVMLVACLGGAGDETTVQLLKRLQQVAAREVTGRKVVRRVSSDSLQLSTWDEDGGSSRSSMALPRSSLRTSQNRAVALSSHPIQCTQPPSQKAPALAAVNKRPAKVNVLVAPPSAAISPKTPAGKTTPGKNTPRVAFGSSQRPKPNPVQMGDADCYVSANPRGPPYGRAMSPGPDLAGRSGRLGNVLASPYRPDRPHSTTNRTAATQLRPPSSTMPVTTGFKDPRRCSSGGSSGGGATAVSWYPAPAEGSRMASPYNSRYTRYEERDSAGGSEPELRRSTAATSSAAVSTLPKTPSISGCPTGTIPFPTSLKALAKIPEAQMRPLRPAARAGMVRSPSPQAARQRLVPGRQAEDVRRSRSVFAKPTPVHDGVKAGPRRHYLESQYTALLCEFQHFMAADRTPRQERQPRTSNPGSPAAATKPSPQAAGTSSSVHVSRIPSLTSTAVPSPPKTSIPPAAQSAERPSSNMHPALAQPISSIIEALASGGAASDDPSLDTFNTLAGMDEDTMLGPGLLNFDVMTQCAATSSTPRQLPGMPSAEAGTSPEGGRPAHTKADTVDASDVILAVDTAGPRNTRTSVAAMVAEINARQCYAQSVTSPTRAADSHIALKDLLLPSTGSPAPTAPPSLIGPTSNNTPYGPASMAVQQSVLASQPSPPSLSAKHCSADLDNDAVVQLDWSDSEVDGRPYGAPRPNSKAAEAEFQEMANDTHQAFVISGLVGVVVPADADASAVQAHRSENDASVSLSEYAVSAGARVPQPQPIHHTAVDGNMDASNGSVSQVAGKGGGLRKWAGKVFHMHSKPLR